jgi:hypothetical protein
MSEAGFLPKQSARPAFSAAPAPAREKQLELIKVAEEARFVRQA